MINARIVDNKPYCTKCGQVVDTEVRDLRQVRYRGESLTLFTKHCHNCREDIQYLADVLIEKATRYEVEDKMENIGE